jgi:hypothetical protein
LKFVDRVNKYDHCFSIAIGLMEKPVNAGKEFERALMVLVAARNNEVVVDGGNEKVEVTVKKRKGVKVKSKKRRKRILVAVVNK